MLQSLRLLLLLHTLYHTPSITPFPAFSSPPQFYKDGLSLPATVIAVEAGNIVTQVKTADKDGYAAVQVRAGRHAGTGRQAVAGRQAACLRSPNSALAHRVQNSKLLHNFCAPPAQVGYKVCREDKITKPEVGHLDKAGAQAMKHLREFKVGLKRKGWQHAQPVQASHTPTLCAPPQISPACCVLSHSSLLHVPCVSLPSLNRRSRT